MSERERVLIRKLATGVRGLDEVLGGGLPEYSFNLIAGSPGTGKTTLAQQILFATATPDRPGLFFTVLGEPAVKILRYQQQFAFFDPARVGRDVHFLNLSEEVLNKSLDVILDRMSADIERVHPAIVVVDSFRTVVQAADPPRANNELQLQHFVQRLALRLTSWETTSFLIGEFGDDQSRDPVFTAADGVLWLANEVERNSTVRKLRVTKVRRWDSNPRRPAWEGGGKTRTECGTRQFRSEDAMHGSPTAKHFVRILLSNGSRTGPTLGVRIRIRLAPTRGTTFRASRRTPSCSRSAAE